MQHCFQPTILSFFIMPPLEAGFFSDQIIASGEPQFFVPLCTTNYAFQLHQKQVFRRPNSNIRRTAMQSLHQRSQPYISVRCQYTSDLYPNLHNPSLNLPGTFVTLLAAHQCRPSLVFISLLCTCIYNDCLRKVHLQLLLTLARPSNRYTLLFIYNTLSLLIQPFVHLIVQCHQIMGR